MVIDGEEVTVSSIIVINPLLNSIIEKEKSTRAWVGRKYDGVYIGFRKIWNKTVKEIREATIKN